MTLNYTKIKSLKTEFKLAHNGSNKKKKSLQKIYSQIVQKNIYLADS